MNFYFEVLRFCSVFGHFQPLMASEVTNDLRIELGDLNYICSNASLACKGFLDMIETQQWPTMIHTPACFAAAKKSENITQYICV